VTELGIAMVAIDSIFSLLYEEEPKDRISRWPYL